MSGSNLNLSKVSVEEPRNRFDFDSQIKKKKKQKPNKHSKAFMNFAISARKYRKKVVSRSLNTSLFEQKKNMQATPKSKPQ